MVSFQVDFKQTCIHQIFAYKPKKLVKRMAGELSAFSAIRIQPAPSVSRGQDEKHYQPLANEMQNVSPFVNVGYEPIQQRN
jgi:hypothetical protein